MHRFKVQVWVAAGINLVSPLLPVLAATWHSRSGRYQALPWMKGLAALLTYSLLVNWAMVGLSVNGLHNAWLSDLAYLLEALLMLGVLSSVGPRPLPRVLLVSGAAAMVVPAAWDLAHLGLQVKWPLTQTATGLVLGAICIWRLLDLLVGQEPLPAWHQPAFWLLSSWSLMLAIELTFYPMQNIFLRHLSRAWHLAPWFANYVVGLILNLGVARTFLCPKPSSS